MVEEGEIIEDSSDKGEELEEIIEEEFSRDAPIYPQISSAINPSLERMRIVETSLEGGLKDVEVENDFEEHGQYGVKDDYVAGKDYDSLGDGDYESSIEIETPRAELSLSTGGIPPQQGSSSIGGGGGYPGSKKRDGKKYHSHLEAGARDEEKKKKDKRMW